CARTPGAFW
nr:immunoglobulin heavy chain junction region [Mus musculus]MBK4184584.1 immunoglobulin heavy chain junction region [Mus musculus]MBK4184585.1 immunoglobulin heavy chain junction region [Mus musculus]MBK4184586.1 immunoglobulin heavy chain junction region [Mus musculus]MBK4184587.1 immunoglobulin heavy chain junction region [Mus musculus]